MLKKLCLLLSLAMIASNLHCGDAESTKRKSKPLTAKQIRREMQRIENARIAPKRGLKACNKERTLAIKAAREDKHQRS